MIHAEKGLIPFWNDEMIDLRFSDAALSANRAERAETVMVFDRPWEGNATNYFTVLRDDGLYRMYYETQSVMDPTYTEGLNVCYAESRDGIHWERPVLGLCEFRGSRENNILMKRIPDNITVMKDENPACPPERRYKAIMSNWGSEGFLGGEAGSKDYCLVCRTSADGIRFEDYCVVSRGYAYDSQNTVHWNPHTGRYYAYFREFHDGPAKPGLNETRVRGILVSESEDFLHWSEPVPLRFGGGEDYPLYTNCVAAYPCDTRWYVGFPTRYTERSAWTPNYDRLCGVEKRRERMVKMEPREGLAITDCVFMSSRDNVNWFRFDEACITPGPENGLNWLYGDCYPAVGGVIPLPSRYPGEPDELSLYVNVHHLLDVPVELVRYVFRQDGFASVKSGYRPGRLLTKAFTFDADELALNFRTSARGYVRLRILDERGLPLEGYDAGELFGDAVERIVDFEKPLAALAGKPVRLEFGISDAEVFALRLR